MITIPVRDDLAGLVADLDPMVLLTEQDRYDGQLVAREHGAAQPHVKVQDLVGAELVDEHVEHERRGQGTVHDGVGEPGSTGELDIEVDRVVVADGGREVGDLLAGDRRRRRFDDSLAHWCTLASFDGSPEELVHQ